MNHEAPVSAMEKNVYALLSIEQKDYESVFPNSGLAPRFVRCDAETKTLELAFDLQPWMRNPAGLLHGGVTAILLDNTMGTAIAALVQVHTPTLTMTINYVRPSPLDTTVHVRARVALEGRTASHLTAEIFLPDAPDRILATATGVYYTKKA